MLKHHQINEIINDVGIRHNQLQNLDKKRDFYLSEFNGQKLREFSADSSFYHSCDEK